jgi:hypothetical protein
MKTVQGVKEVKTEEAISGNDTMQPPTAKEPSQSKKNDKPDASKS